MSRAPCGGFWKRCSRGNKALLMFKECPVTNECPGLCLAIKGTSRTVCDDIFLFLKRVKRKKNVWRKKTPPFKSCRASHFVCHLSSCLWNSQCLSKHDETWDQRGASNDLSLSQGSSLSWRSTQNESDIEQGTVHVSDTICLWRGPMLHVKSDERKQRQGKEKRTKGKINFQW